MRYARAMTGFRHKVWDRAFGLGSPKRGWLRLCLLVAHALVASAGCKGGSEPATTDAGPGPATPTSTLAPGSARPSFEAAVPAVSSASIGGPANGIDARPDDLRKAVNPASLPEYKGPVGSISGLVLVEGDVAPGATLRDWERCPKAKGMYGVLFREGAKRPDGRRPLLDAVVAATDYAPGHVVYERTAVREIAFADCAFPSRTLTMTYGQRLEISNQDRYSFAPDLMQAPLGAMRIPPPKGKGEAVKLRPPKPGYFTIVDRLGSDFPTMDLYVLHHPIHTVSGAGGEFRLVDVPVGKVKVHARVAVVGETTSVVNVEEGKETKVELVLRFKMERQDAGATDASAPRGGTVDAAPRGRGDMRN